VPAYGPQNDVTLKMPAFEWVHVQLHQQKGMISLSPPTICNSADPSGNDGLLPAISGRREDFPQPAVRCGTDGLRAGVVNPPGLT
ncbi:hypothetical protein, partial [Escherichia coli]|uniref:hypothetical protein n=1 Tax=Escherichia coli TaxID=562 RepID=UPI0031B60DA3